MFVALETVRRPSDADVFIAAWDVSRQAWQKEITNALKARHGQSVSHEKSAAVPDNWTDLMAGTLIVVDALNPLAAASPTDLPGVLSAFISPTTSLLAVYHQDVPLTSQVYQRDPYAPAPSTLLRYIATTIMTVHSPRHVLARKAARDRSHIEPSFGLAEGTEGVLQGLGANTSIGVVLAMEHRRKSGRGVREWYYLPSPMRDHPATSTGGGLGAKTAKAEVMLLDEHPQYRTAEGEASIPEAEAAATFELGLSEKQRMDREGVVLPYFDAQKGGGEGGRILYDMGSEDDFDEEEDEI